MLDMVSSLPLALHGPHNSAAAFSSQELISSHTPSLPMGQYHSLSGKWSNFMLSASPPDYEVVKLHSASNSYLNAYFNFSLEPTYNGRCHGISPLSDVYEETDDHYKDSRLNLTDSKEGKWERVRNWESFYICPGTSHKSSACPCSTSNSVEAKLSLPAEKVAKRGKRIRFADDCGLKLSDVRIMKEASDTPPVLSNKCFKDLNLVENSSSSGSSLPSTDSPSSGSSLSSTDSPSSGSSSSSLSLSSSISSLSHETPLTSLYASSSTSALPSSHSVSSSSSPSSHPAASSSLLDESCRYNFVPNFVQPSADYVAYHNKLQDSFILLEHVVVKSNVIEGRVRVRNMSFEKTVKAHVTFDDWKTASDFYTTYLSTASVAFTEFDVFSFEINLPKDLPTNARIQFALCYVSNETEYWDNNGGCNYELIQKPNVPSSIEAKRAAKKAWLEADKKSLGSLDHSYTLGSTSYRSSSSNFCTPYW